MTACTHRIIRNRPLHGMFTAVPPRYDLINRVITWGLDARWRRQAARVCLASQPRKVLDLGCGTGNLAVILALTDGNVEVVGIDYSQPMLEIAIKKAASLRGRKPLFIYGDAANLPFPDSYFDTIGISFAFRNLTYKNPLAQRYLAEAWRVLKPGGHFVILETSQPKAKVTQKLYHLYLRWFVFRAGYLLSGNRGAYHYLAESASQFYTADEVKEMLLTAGFREVFFQPLFYGAIGLHVAIK